MQTSAWATFSYDAVGNILVKAQQGSNPLTFTYNTANRLVTMQQGTTLTTYTYDANGNLTGENAAGTLATYAYDNENRLTHASDLQSVVLDYTYDGDGLRRTLVDAAPDYTTFLWDGDDLLMEKQMILTGS